MMNYQDSYQNADLRWVYPKNKEMSKISSILIKFENYVLIFLFAVMILMAFTQVAGRLFFGVGFSWADGFVFHLLLWTAVLGASVATREKSHITIDIISKFVSGRNHQVIGFLTNLFSSFVCALFSYAATKFILDEKSYGTIAFGKIPTWIAGSIIPLMFLIMSVRFLIDSYIDIRNFIRSFKQ